MGHSMQHTFRLLGTAAALLIALGAAWWGRLPADEGQAKLAAGEEEIHRVPGAADAGRPAVADPVNSGRLKLTVLDAATGGPTFCRVNVVGSDGDFYEPAENPLAAWSLVRLGNRPGKGPFRYYGWFFYSPGECEVAVPPGATRVEVWKGFEYRPVTITKDVPRGERVALQVTLERSADMAARGWYSGDTHIHLDRKTEQDDDRALDLAACEDLRFAHILCMNDPRTYQPLMEHQIHPQLPGLGPKSERRRGIYQIASGQEYRCSTFGHICLIGLNRLVDAEGLKTNPNNWPTFGQVADECRALGGLAFHAHGGYEQEIYADFAQRATDGVELLQFAEYRGISLAGWYHILNAGFRFPAIGASDYPYCRALGDCRTYVHLRGAATFENWNQGAAAGRSFFTTGPLLEVQVDGKLPGDTVALAAAGEHTLPVRIEVVSLVAPIAEIQLIEGGEVRERKTVTAGQIGQPVVWQTQLSVRDSTWAAVRVFARSPGGRENTEAHTNPVYISVNGGKPCRRDSLEWLLQKLDDQIAKQAARQFDERDKVLAYYQKSRQVLQGLLETAPRERKER
jgi:hypothetical protein